jgi:hypothetical protein
LCGMARLIMGAGTFWNCRTPKEAQEKDIWDIALDVAWSAAGQAELRIPSTIDARAWADKRAAAFGEATWAVARM